MILGYTVSGRSAPVKSFGACRSSLSLSLFFVFVFHDVAVSKPWSCSAFSAWLVTTIVGTLGAGAGAGVGGGGEGEVEGTPDTW